MLEEYEKKRHFKKTPEPPVSDLKKSSDKLIFVVQRHDARNLHYDFRLEMDGVLKSWAVPKEPPKEAGIRRLAVETEDHMPILKAKSLQGSMEPARSRYGIREPLNF